MAVVYFSLGANIGDKRNNMITAVALLSERVGSILALSDLYETTPWGFVSENNFLNAALMMDTTLSPNEILALTQERERNMGLSQKSEGEYHDRVIDIDILMYDDWVIDTPLLTLPHPLMHQRSFVLGPLSEIAHTCIHPVLNRSIGELYLALPTKNRKVCLYPEISLYLCTRTDVDRFVCLQPREKMLKSKFLFLSIASASSTCSQFKI